MDREFAGVHRAVLAGSEGSVAGLVSIGISGLGLSLTDDPDVGGPTLRSCPKSHLAYRYYDAACRIPL